MLKENKNTKEHIVFLGETGFPKGLASIQRMTLMAKALLRVGYGVTVLCRKGVWEPNEKGDENITGSYDGVAYVYTSKSVYRPIGFFNRNTQKLQGMYKEFLYLRQLNRNLKLDYAIVSNMSALHVLRYRLYATILDFPIVVNFVEMASSMKDRSSWINRLNDYVYDKLVIKVFDGALPISDNLMAYYKTISNNKPSLKLPILCDFDKFNVPKKKQDPYFLYCGSIAYKEVIDFIIEAFKNVNKQTKLFMVISGGSTREMENLQKEIDHYFKTSSICLFTNIPYSQLVDLYTNALALLIPLRPTLQDASRFPHKIGEYLAAGNPVITTKVGEIINYFEDGKTALIADNYTINAFAEKMNYVLDHPNTSKLIGSNGKELGLKEFDYKMHGSRLQKYLKELSRAK